MWLLDYNKSLHNRIQRQSEENKSQAEEIKRLKKHSSYILISKYIETSQSKSKSQKSVMNGSRWREGVNKGKYMLNFNTSSD